MADRLIGAPIKRRTLKLRWSISTCTVALATLITVGSAKSRTARETLARNHCINNLRLLEGIKAQLALERKLIVGDPVSSEEFAKYWPQFKSLTCPKGGNYSINAVGENPTCSIAGHELEVSPFAALAARGRAEREAEINRLRAERQAEIKSANAKLIELAPLVDQLERELTAERSKGNLTNQAAMDAFNAKAKRYRELLEEYTDANELLKEYTDANQRVRKMAR